MTTRNLMVVLLVLGSALSAFGAANFDPNVLADTQWCLRARGTDTWVDEDGKGKDKIDDALFLTFNADGTFELTDKPLDLDDDFILTGTWECSSKGKLSLALDPNSLELWFIANICSDDEDIPDESTLQSSSNLRGTVKAKGTVLSLKIIAVFQASGTYQTTVWDEEWNESEVDVDGLAKVKVTLTGSYDTAAAPEQPGYRFTDVTMTGKIRKYAEKTNVSFDVTFEPENTYYGQFSIVFTDDSFTDMTGYYLVEGKTKLLYMYEEAVEEIAQPTTLEYLNSIHEDLWTLDSYDDNWEVDYDNFKIVLTENVKKGTAKISLPYTFEVWAWDEYEDDDIEVVGKINLKGSGVEIAAP